MPRKVRRVIKAREAFKPSLSHCVLTLKCQFEENVLYAIDDHDDGLHVRRIVVRIGFEDRVELGDRAKALARRR